MAQPLGRSPKVLIVHSDPAVAKLLTTRFLDRSCDADYATSSREAVELLQPASPPDIILIECTLGSGTHHLYEVAPYAQVLFMASEKQPEILRAATPKGADWISEPFTFDNLAARVKELLAQRSQDTIVTLGDVIVNFTTYEAHRHGRSIEFTALELDILYYLARNVGVTVTRKELLRDVWGLPRGVRTRTVDRHIASIRKKISDDPHDNAFITTIFGKGYRLTGARFPARNPRAPA